MSSDPLFRIKQARDHQRKADAEIEAALFEARLQGRFEVAWPLTDWSRRRALAATRRVNESLGRPIRWGNN